MALYPALPLFTDAYLADTRHLTTEEHGAYLLLLMCAWRSDGCELEDDDKTLARIAGLSPTRWRRLKPVMAKFFAIRQGVWQQKKLQAVYSDVASRVARNKANGARGGRARAAKATDRLDSREPTGSSKHGADQTATRQTTKTKPKAKIMLPLAAGATDNQEEGDCLAALPFHADVWRSQIAAVCADGTLLDGAVIHYWNAAGVDLELDAVPTIEAVGERELARTGRAPHSLGYYRDAVVEAATDRQKAVQGGLKRKPVPVLLQGQKKDFDPTNEDDWKTLLGDPNDRFRGDHMARNWFVSSDNPVFRERGLGANPRLSVTSHIPQSVCKMYGAAWLWL